MRRTCTLATLLFAAPARASELITPATSSEVADLEPTWTDPTEAFATEDINCPHEDTSLLRWEDASTWDSGAVPIAGEDVTIPEHKHVLIVMSPLSDGGVLGKITVPSSSSLVIGENLVDGIRLDTTGMLVEGAFLIGSAGCRLSSYITITLHGARPGVTKNTEIDQSAWVKGIAASGNLQIHG